MEIKLRDLLDKIYELEGLVRLLMERDDASEDLLRLISSKGRYLGKVCEAIQSSSPVDSDDGDEDGYDSQFHLQEYSIDDDNYHDQNAYPMHHHGRDAEHPYGGNRGKLIFSISERNRFRRELFDDSEVDFNNTLAALAAMEDYEEAEEYFISEEGFNMGNPVVREFLNVVKKYFR